MDDILWVAKTKSGRLVRLTKKVWSEKILIGHPEFSLNPEYLNEVRETIEEPEYIVEGWYKELLALKWCKIAPGGAKYLCVVYREYADEGYVITAFFISRHGKLLRRNRIWPKQTL
jgi:hypothetical protein